MTYESVMIEIQDAVAILTINRPKSLNALNAALLKELFRAVEEIEQNESIRALVITGSGEKAFVAGADITELARFNALEAKHFAAFGHRFMSALQKLPVPVVAAVNGFALGGGLELALSCDFIYASENAKFGLPEITLGLIPGFGGTQRLARLIGKNKAKELIFTGTMISAKDAAEMGIVNRVLAPDQLMVEAMKTAVNMAAKGRASLNAAKHAVNYGTQVDLASGCQIEIDAFALCFASSDAAEGTRAFLEKRKPVFEGRLTG